jgi:hypothetical protein
MADSNKHENQQKSLNFEIVKEMHIGVRNVILTE